MTLTAAHVTLAFEGRTILDDISCQPLPGGLTALLGLNGAGKSTLLRCLAGLLPPKTGEILLDGADLYTLSPKVRSRTLAYLPQHIPLRELTVEDYVLLGCAPWLRWGTVPGKSWREKTRNALEQLSLTHLAHRPMDQISGGERQRAAFARTLLTGAKGLLLDEPTASLDMRGQHALFAQLTALQAQTGLTALVSLHDPNLALTYAQRVLVLHKGHLTQVDRGKDFALRLLEVLRPIYGTNLHQLAEQVFVWKEG